MHRQTRHTRPMPCDPPVRHATIRRLALHGGLVCVAILVLLSWLPAREMARTGLSGRIEHFIAYAGTTIAFAVAAGGGGRPWLRAGLLLALAGVLEVGQLWAPGRNASIWDWLAGGTGVVVATLLAPPLARRLAWLAGVRHD